MEDLSLDSLGFVESLINDPKTTVEKPKHRHGNARWLVGWQDMSLSCGDTVVCSTQPLMTKIT